jgi:hypothetical protein
LYQSLFSYANLIVGLKVDFTPGYDPTYESYSLKREILKIQTALEGVRDCRLFLNIAEESVSGLILQI